MFGQKKTIPEIRETVLAAYSDNELADVIVTRAHLMDFPALLRIKKAAQTAVSERTKEIMAMLEMPIVEHVPTKERKKRAVHIKYRDSSNPENVWTGIGKPKRWLQEYLDAGRSKEEFAVTE